MGHFCYILCLCQPQEEFGFQAVHEREIEFVFISYILKVREHYILKNCLWEFHQI